MNYFPSFPFIVVWVRRKKKYRRCVWGPKKHNTSVTIGNLRNVTGKWVTRDPVS